MLTPVNVQFSILRSTALALLRGDIRGSEYVPETFARTVEPVRDLAAKGNLVHDWSFTLHQLKGLDAGLQHGGGRRSADMLQFYRTSGEFRRMFGSARAIGPRDVIRLLQLPREDRRFFARRWTRSLESHLQRLTGRDEANPRPLGDLRKLSFRMGARVTVVQRNGRQLTAERIIPTGMAGDPNRAAVVEEKFSAECDPVIGPVRRRRIWKAIQSLPNSTVMDWAGMMERPEGAIP